MDRRDFFRTLIAAPMAALAAIGWARRKPVGLKGFGVAQPEPIDFYVPGELTARPGLMGLPYYQVTYTAGSYMGIPRAAYLGNPPTQQDLAVAREVEERYEKAKYSMNQQLIQPFRFSDERVAKSLDDLNATFDRWPSC